MAKLRLRFNPAYAMGDEHIEADGFQQGLDGFIVFFRGEDDDWEEVASYKKEAIMAVIREDEQSQEMP